MPPLLRRCVFVFALACSASASSAAQTAPNGDPPSATAPRRRAEAQEFFRRATTEYDAGRFAVAAALFRAAFEADRSNTAYLFNAARAAERADDRPQAVSHYEWLLRELPESAADARRSVQESLDRLRAPTPPPVREPPRVDPPPTDRPPVSVRPVDPAPPRFSAGPFVLLGGSALAFGGAALFFALQQGALARCRPGMMGAIECREADESAARSMNIGANISLGLGGGLAVAGGVWLVIQATRRLERPAVAVVPMTNGVAVGGVL